MTAPKAKAHLPPRTPAYVDRETGAAELCISADTWDRWVISGVLPAPAPGFPEGQERWRMDDVRAAIAARNSENPEEPGWIYFVQCHERVKIGYAKDVANRIASMQVGAPYPLVLLHKIPGSIITEREMHIRFAKYRAIGEWFRVEGELAEYLTTVENDSGE